MAITWILTSCMTHYKTTAAVRKLQAAVAVSLQQTVSEASYKRMINIMTRDYIWFDGYSTQYLDILNCRFLAMNREKRLKNIPTMAKRLAEQGQEYREVRSEVVEAARRHNCPVGDIRPRLECPEEIDW